MMTDEQRATLEQAACFLEQKHSRHAAETLRALLAAHPGQPEPRAEVTLTEAQIDAIADEGRRNAAGGIYAGSVYDFAYACIDAARTGASSC